MHTDELLVCYNLKLYLLVLFLCLDFSVYRSGKALYD